MQCARSVGSRRDQARWRRWRAPASASATCARRARSTRKQARRRLGRAARTSHSKSASVGGWMPEALPAAVGGRRRAQPVIAVLFFFFFCVLRSRCASRAKDVWCGRARGTAPARPIKSTSNAHTQHNSMISDSFCGNDVLSWHARTRVSLLLAVRLCDALELVLLLHRVAVRRAARRVDQLVGAARRRGTRHSTTITISLAGVID